MLLLFFLRNRIEATLGKSSKRVVPPQRSARRGPVSRSIARRPSARHLRGQAPLCLDRGWHVELLIKELKGATGLGQAQVTKQTQRVERSVALSVMAYLVLIHLRQRDIPTKERGVYLPSSEILLGHTHNKGGSLHAPYIGVLLLTLPLGLHSKVSQLNTPPSQKGQQVHYTGKDGTRKLLKGNITGDYLDWRKGGSKSAARARKIPKSLISRYI